MNFPPHITHHSLPPPLLLPPTHRVPLTQRQKSQLSKQRVGLLLLRLCASVWCTSASLQSLVSEVTQSNSKCPLMRGAQFGQHEWYLTTYYLYGINSKVWWSNSSFGSGWTPEFAKAGANGRYAPSGPPCTLTDDICANPIACNDLNL